MSQRQARDPAERRAILDETTELVLQAGLRPTAAAKQVAKAHGVSFQTIFKWAEAAGRPLVDLAGGRSPGTEQMLAAAREAWIERQQLEAVEAARAAAQLRETIHLAAQEGDARLVQSAAIGYGIMIDKALLLSGKATQRTEVGRTREEILADVIQLRDRLAARAEADREGR